MSWGQVDTSQVVAETVQVRFQQFIQAVLSKRIVPLVGAGVSIDSVGPTRNLTETLRNALRCDPAFDTDGSGDDDMARLAEIVFWRHGAEFLCDILEIAHWTDIRPTRAHRYLALLACEGLICHIITTNYDCGIEIAWREARGLDDRWRAITKAEELARPGYRWDGADLRLYKINGCARNLVEAKDKNARSVAAKSILLTDQQLQMFYQRSWARDLFHVLMRERQIVFSGFGSEEPQIRHAVMDILKEFASLNCHNNDAKHPFLWACQYDRTIGFFVLQALVEEAKVRNRLTTTGHLKFCFDNVFSANDTKFFNNGGGGLDAGDFWRKVWVEAVRHGLCDPEGPAVNEFVRMLTGSRYRQQNPKARWLADLWISAVDEVFRDTRKFHKLLGEPPEWKQQCARGPDPCAPRFLCPEKDDVTTGGYLSLAKEPEYWISLVLLIWVFPNEITEARLLIGEPRVILHVSERLSIYSNPLRTGETGISVTDDYDDKLKRIEMTIFAFHANALKCELIEHTINDLALKRAVHFTVARALVHARAYEAERRTERRTLQRLT